MSQQIQSLETSRSQPRRSRVDVDIPALPVEWRPACRLAAIATLVGFACTLITILTVVTVGAEPTTAAEYFDVLINDRLVGLLRLDFASLLHVVLMPATAFGLYTALRSRYPTAALIPAALVFGGMVMAISTHSAFSMIDLANKYALTGGAAERQQLLAAGEAVIAKDWYRSTGGFVAAFFSQGSFLVFSLLMLKSRIFGRTAAVSGLLANGLDLGHVVVMLFSPAVGAGMMAVAGIFYLVWYPAMFRELKRLGR